MNKFFEFPGIGIVPMYIYIPTRIPTTLKMHFLPCFPFKQDFPGKLIKTQNLLNVKNIDIIDTNVIIN